MMISLYRRTPAKILEYRSVSDRGGEIIAATTHLCDGEVVSCNERIGAISSQVSDNRLSGLLGDWIESGFRILYAYVPPSAAPVTSRALASMPGVDVIPDPTDGLPMWRTNRRGAKPVYLLFTVLSSEAK